VQEKTVGARNPDGFVLGACDRVGLVSIYNDLAGLRWLRKYFKGRERHAYLGLESWAERGIAVYFMSPPATGAVERIAALYAIEKEIRGRLPTSDAAFATPARGTASLISAGN
jgi:hypothetical protein